MLEINLAPKQGHDVKVLGVQFKVTEPLMQDIADAEMATHQASASIKLLERMGVPDEVMKKLSASQAGEMSAELLGLFKEKK